MDRDPLEVSAGSIAASVGTVLLVGLAGLALYGVGIVLVFEGVNQPGRWTGLAVAYLLLAVVAPIAIARKMHSSGSTWRRTSAVCAFVILAMSILFFPGRNVSATVRGDSGAVYSVVHRPGQWSCCCGHAPYGWCSHLRAVQLITAPAGPVVLAPDLMGGGT